MSDRNIVFYDAVQLIYADARRQVREARKVGEAAQPYRLLTFALETVYPEILAGVDDKPADAPGEAHAIALTRISDTVLTG